MYDTFENVQLFNIALAYFVQCTVLSCLQCHASACTFYNVHVPCYRCVTWYKTCTANTHLRRSFCGIMPLHTARVWAGSFSVPVFLTFLNTMIL